MDNEYILDDKIRIIKGDALEKLDLIENKSIQTICIDPPYNIGKDFGNDSDKQKMDDYLLWCDSWITECLRILKPQGTLYIYGFSEILAFIRTRITCNVRWLVWHYTNKVIPSLNHWQRTHESILCCYKNKPVFNRDDVREPYTQEFLKNAAGKVHWIRDTTALLKDVRQAWETPGSWLRTMTESYPQPSEKADKKSSRKKG